MRKPGDICMIFASPLNCEKPIDQARLLKLIRDCGKLEQWSIEYLNDEGQFYEALIKKEEDGTNKKSTQ